MADLSVDQNQGNIAGPGVTPFGPTPKSAPGAGYYTPATVASARPEGPVDPTLPLSSPAYNPAQHDRTDTVTFYVRGTNSGGMSTPDGHGQAKHNEYFSPDAMDDFDAMLDPKAAQRVGRGKSAGKDKSGAPTHDNQLHAEVDWYGGLDSELARRAAGRKLYSEQVLPAWEDGKKVNLVGHSHGGNTINECGGEVVARTQYTAALSAGLDAKPGSPEFKAAQAALSDREGIIRRDLAEFQARYGKRPTGGAAELYGDLAKELAEVNRDKKGLSGADPAITAQVKQRTSAESAALQRAKLGDIMYLDTPFRSGNSPLTENPQFANRAQNIYNVYNPDDFVVRNLGGKNTLGGGTANYPGFDSFGRSFEVGNEAGYTLPEGGNIHNIPWHHQNRSMMSPLTGSHSDMIGGADAKTDPAGASYFSGIRSGIAQQIKTGQYGGPDAKSTDLASQALRGAFSNLQKNAYNVDDQAAMDPVTGELSARRQGAGAQLDLPIPSSTTGLRSTGMLFGDLHGQANTPLGNFSGGVGDIRRNHYRVGLESSRDEAGNDIMSVTGGRTTGVDNLRGKANTPLGDAAFSAGTINQGFQGRLSQITNDSGLAGYTGDASWGGVRARDLNTSTNIAGVRTNSHLGNFDSNTLASGGYVTQPDGSKAVVGGASWGGVRMNDLSTTVETDKVTAGVKLGQFSNANGGHGRAGWDGTSQRYFAEGGGDVGDTSLKDFQAGIATKDGRASANGGFSSLRVGGVEGGGHVDYDPKTGQVHAQGGGRGGGFNLDNAQANARVKGLGSVDASVGNVTTDTIVQDAQFNGNLRKGEASVGHMEGMGFSAKDGKIVTQNDLLHLRQEASFGSIGTSNSLDGARLGYDFTNLRDPRLSAGFKNLGYAGVSGENLRYGMQGPGGTNVDARLGSFGTSALNIADGNLDLSRNGLNASVGKTSYDAVSLKGLDAKGGIGNLAQFQAKLGEGSYNHFGADSASLQVNKDGVSASMRNGNYRYLDGKNVELSESFLNGAVSSRAKADEVSVGGVDVGKLRYNSNLRNTNLEAENVGAHGAKVTNLDASQNIGAAGANMQAKQLNVLDLNVGRVNASSRNFGTQGNASVDNATLDAVNVKDGHAGLTYNGKELVGASGSYQAGMGLKRADANYDLLHGKMGGQVQDLSAGAQLNNASVNLFGNKIAIPDMGAKVNVNAGANVDLFKGQAQANLGLGGSSVNFAGHKLTVPDFVQASAGVNLSQGAVNANLGGKNGVGADVNLAQGKVDLNLFGHHVDVVQGAKDVAGAVGSGAKKVWNKLTSWW